MRRLPLGSLLRGDGSFRDALGLCALVESLLGNDRAEGKTLGACQIAFRECESGPRLCEARLRLSEGDLEGPAIDREQKIALLHHLAVLKMDRLQVAGNARPHFYGLDGDEAADILVLVRNHFADWLGNRDLRRRRRGLRLRLALSTGRQRGHEQDCQQAGHSQCLHERRDEAHHLGTPLAWCRVTRPDCAGTHRGPTNVGLQIPPRIAPALAPTLWPSGRPRCCRGAMDAERFRKFACLWLVRETYR